MKLLPILPFISMAYAFDTLRAGIMYISRFGGKPTHQSLIIHGDRLVKADEGSRLDYNKQGTLKLTGEDKYLRVDEDGKLVFVDEPFGGFVLTPEAGWGHKQTLSYKGESVFQICDDDSVGFKSDCEEAREIVITYEDINRYR